MRKWLGVVSLLLCFSATAFAQGSRTYTVHNTTPDSSVRLIGSGIAYHLLTWSKTGTVSACSVKLQQSSDNASWSDLIASQTCTSNGQSSITNVNANYIRINPTAFTGSGSVSVRWNGYITNPGGGGSGIVSGQANGVIPLATGSTTIGAQSHCDDGNTTAGTVTCNEPFVATSLASANNGTNAGLLSVPGNTTLPATTPANSFGFIGPNSASFTKWFIQPTATGPAATCIPFLGALAGAQSVSQMGCGVQYVKGSCTEVWGGSGTSFALASGDDAISNNTCYNDSGVTRTITAVKCRSDNGTNTTTVHPTFGAAGIGTTILSGAVTCGSSLTYSSTGTLANTAWTTGTGINPVMGGTLTGTSIAVIVEYTY